MENQEIQNQLVQSDSAINVSQAQLIAANRNIGFINPQTSSLALNNLQSTTSIALLSSANIATLTVPPTRNANTNDSNESQVGQPSTSYKKDALFSVPFMPKNSEYWNTLEPALKYNRSLVFNNFLVSLLHTVTPVNLDVSTLTSGPKKDFVIGCIASFAFNYEISSERSEDMQYNFCVNTVTDLSQNERNAAFVFSRREIAKWTIENKLKSWALRELVLTSDKGMGAIFKNVNVLSSAQDNWCFFFLPCDFTVISCLQGGYFRFSQKAIGPEGPDLFKKSTVFLKDPTTSLLQTTQVPLTTEYDQHINEQLKKANETLKKDDKIITFLSRLSTFPASSTYEPNHIQAALENYLVQTLYLNSEYRIIFSLPNSVQIAEQFGKDVVNSLEKKINNFNTKKNGFETQKHTFQNTLQKKKIKKQELLKLFVDAWSNVRTYEKKEMDFISTADSDLYMCWVNKKVQESAINIPVLKEKTERPGDSKIVSKSDSINFLLEPPAPVTVETQNSLVNSGALLANYKEQVHKHQKGILNFLTNFNTNKNLIKNNGDRIEMGIILLDTVDKLKKKQIGFKEKKIADIFIEKIDKQPVDFIKKNFLELKDKHGNNQRILQREIDKTHFEKLQRNDTLWLADTEFSQIEQLNNHIAACNNAAVDLQQELETFFKRSDVVAIFEIVESLFKKDFLEREQAYSAELEQLTNNLEAEREKMLQTLRKTVEREEKRNTRTKTVLTWGGLSAASLTVLTHPIASNLLKLLRFGGKNNVNIAQKPEVAEQGNKKKVLQAIGSVIRTVLRLN